MTNAQLRETIEEFLKQKKEIKEDETIQLYYLQHNLIHAHIVKGSVIILPKR